MNQKEILRLPGLAMRTWAYRLGLRRMPVALLLFPTFRCNLQCRGCNVPLGAKAHPESGVESWRQVLGEARQHGIRHVAISGGEPLLYPGIFELIREAKALDLTTVLTTNATLLTEERFDELVRAGLSQLTVSLDGLREIHDAFRDAPGVFEKVDRALSRIKAIRVSNPDLLPVYLNTVIARPTYTGIPALIDYARQIGVQGVAFQPLLTPQVRNKERNRDLFFTTEDCARLKDLLEQLTERHGRFIRNSGFFLKGTLRYLEEPRDTALLCIPGIRLNLFPDGSTSICSMLPKFGGFGEPLRDRVRGRSWREQVRAGKEGRCPRCWCPGIHEFNAICQPRHWPSLMPLFRAYTRGAPANTRARRDDGGS